MRVGTGIWKGLLRSCQRMRCTIYPKTTAGQFLSRPDLGKSRLAIERVCGGLSNSPRSSACLACICPSSALKPCLSCRARSLATRAATARERRLLRPRPEHGSIRRDQFARGPAQPAGSGDSVRMGQICRSSLAHGTGPKECKVPARCTSCMSPAAPLPSRKTQSHAATEPMGMASLIPRIDSRDGHHG